MLTLNSVQVLEASSWLMPRFSKNFSVPLLPSKELPCVWAGSMETPICWDDGVVLGQGWRWMRPPEAPRSPSRNDRTVWDSHHVLSGLQDIHEMWGTFEISCLHPPCPPLQTQSQILAQAGGFRMGRLFSSGHSLRWTDWRTVGPSNSWSRICSCGMLGLCIWPFLLFKISF